MGPVRRFAGKGAMFICVCGCLSELPLRRAALALFLPSFISIGTDFSMMRSCESGRVEGWGSRDGLEIFLCDNRFDESICGCRCYISSTQAISGWS